MILLVWNQRNFVFCFFFLEKLFGSSMENFCWKFCIHCIINTPQNKMKRATGSFSFSWIEFQFNLVSLPAEKKKKNYFLFIDAEIFSLYAHTHTDVKIGKGNQNENGIMLRMKIQWNQIKKNSIVMYVLNVWVSEWVIIILEIK